MMALEEGARTLEIIPGNDVTELILRYADGRERLVYTDGREYDDEIDAGRRVRATAKWKKQKLVIKGKTDAGATTLTQTFKLDDEGRLHVDTAIDGGGRIPSFDFERVYDPPAAAFAD